MTLSSASTDAQVWAAYDDSASYAEQNSAALCAAFITACRILLRRTPQQALKGNKSVTVDLGQIQKEIVAAKQWLAASQSGGISVLTPTQEFRG